MFIMKGFVVPVQCETIVLWSFCGNLIKANIKTTHTCEICLCLYHLQTYLVCISDWSKLCQSNSPVTRYCGCDNNTVGGPGGMWHSALWSRYTCFRKAEPKRFFFAINYAPRPCMLLKFVQMIYIAYIYHVSKFQHTTRSRSETYGKNGHQKALTSVFYWTARNWSGYWWTLHCSKVKCSAVQCSTHYTCSIVLCSSSQNSAVYNF